MLNLYFLMFFEYLKIGLFAVGGGYATIPFLFNLSETRGWFSSNELINMIAVSNITPGPIGINMATYSGFKTAGITGSLTTTIAIISAPFIVTLFTIYFINKFRENKIIKIVFETLRPVSCALLTGVMIQLILKNIFNTESFFNFEFNLKAFILTLVLFLIYPFVKKRPSLIILFGGIFGILFNTFK